MDQEQKVFSIAAQKLRREEKFTGKMGQDVDEYIATYYENANNYHPGDNKNIQYLYIIFNDDAKIFYCTIKESCENYEQATAK